MASRSRARIRKNKKKKKKKKHPLASKSNKPRFWLVKLPAYVLREWDGSTHTHTHTHTQNVHTHTHAHVLDRPRPENNAQRQSAVLGHVRVSNSVMVDGHPKMSLTIKSRRKDIPTDFNFNITPIHRSMIVFTERGRGRGHDKCRLEGFVELSGSLTPTSNKKYLRFLRSRNKRASVKREVKSFTPAAITEIPKLMNVSARTTYRTTQQPLPSRTKDNRVRMDLEDLKTMLSNLFDNRPDYTLATLLNLTNQPKEFLKQVLATMCDYQKAGRAYVLKPQFQV